MIGMETYFQLFLQGWLSAGVVNLTGAFIVLAYQDILRQGRLMPILWIGTALVLAGYGSITIPYMFRALTDASILLSITDGMYSIGRVVAGIGICAALTWFWRYFHRGGWLLFALLGANIWWCLWYVTAVVQAHT